MVLLLSIYLFMLKHFYLCIPSRFLRNIPTGDKSREHECIIIDIYCLVLLIGEDPSEINRLV